MIESVAEVPTSTSWLRSKQLDLENLFLLKKLEPRGTSPCPAIILGLNI
jgi:hypothetical protein